MLKKINLILVCACMSVGLFAQPSQAFKELITEKPLLWAEREEDPLLYTIEQFQKELPDFNTVEQAVLHSLIAENLWEYYQNNRFWFYGRTSLASNIDQNDIRTWDLKLILENMNRHFKLSLQPKAELRHATLSDYADILIKGDKESAIERPSVYDLLAHRAIQIWKNNEAGITRPKDEFTLDNPIYFAPAKDFITYKIPDQDTISLLYNGISLLQDLMTWHFNQNNFDAFIPLELERLALVRQNYNSWLADSLYEMSLTEMTRHYPRQNALANVYLALADYFVSKDKKKALAYAEFVVKNYTDMRHVNNAKSLIEDIKQPRLSVNIQNVLLPAQPNLMMLEYANVNKVYFSLYRIEQSHFDNNDDVKGGNFARKILAEEKPVLTWEKSIPNPGDFEQHRVELDLPALDFGFYILISSSDQKIDINKSLIASNFINISKLDYIISTDGPLEGYVLDRESGKTVSNAAVKIYTKDYDSQLRKSVRVLKGEAKSNKKGYFKFDLDKEQFLEIRLEQGKDVLDNVPNIFYFPYRTLLKKGENKTKKVLLFTDRTIYRPGQTIYFKGILLEESDPRSEIVSNEAVSLSFLDPNSKTLSKIDLKTNEYGSFSGEFIIPSSGLNGSYMISSPNLIWLPVRVENYKRPSFEITIDPLTDAYKLDQNISIKGSAKTYAGSGLSGAKVSYKISRHARYPFRHFPPLPRRETLIDYGEINCDEEGRFTFDFTAKKDERIKPDMKPSYSYKIEIKVTDLSGETQEISEIIQIASSALLLKLDVPRYVDLTKTQQPQISSTNLSGAKVPSKGIIRIYRIEPADRLLRERLWQAPDQFIFEKTDFTNLFPNDPYKNENNPEDRDKTEFISMAYESEKNSVVDLRLKNFSTGDYFYEIKSLDDFGDSVVFSDYFTIYASDSKKATLQKPFYAFTNNKKFKIGDTLHVLIGTSERNLNVLYRFVRNDKTLEYKWFNLSDAQKEIRIPITEAMQGCSSLQIAAIKNNRTYEYREEISVDYFSKMIVSHLKTFRSTLSPGQNEEWMVNFSDNQGKPVKSEVLVSMYDKSLDVFSPYKPVENFNLASCYTPISYNLNRSNYQTSSQLYYPNYKEFYAKFTNYDRLRWTTVGSRNYMMKSMGAGSGIQLRGTSSLKTSADMAEEQMLFAEDEIAEADNENTQTENPLQIRQNFNETAFFYPHLYSNDSGDVTFSFTVPESLTQWRFWLFAHNKSFQSGSLEHTVLTQKELMVFPNSPRFLREGDSFDFRGRVANLSDQKIQGKANLKIWDVSDSKPLADLKTLDFSIESKQSTTLSWPLSIPKGLQGLRYQISAQTDLQNDGEEQLIPVLSNRGFVTETLPFTALPNSEKTYVFDSFKKAKSSTLSTHKMTLEVASNPVWYAIQAIPSVMEDTYENSISVMNKYYVQALARHIVKQNPQIKQVFEQWKKLSPNSLQSKLQQNEDLKEILIEETPWLLDAENESEQKQRIALYFDENRIDRQSQDLSEKLAKLQLSNGGFVWYPGGRDNREATQHILLNFSRLLRKEAINLNPQQEDMFRKAIKYLDDRVYESYKKDNTAKAKYDGSRPSDIQYLYIRNFFLKYQPLDDSASLAFNYYKALAEKHWSKQSKYMQALLCVFFKESGQEQLAQNVLNKLKETALHSPELGMYWRNESGWYWYQSSIDAQCQLIEAFDLLENKQSVALMQQWLLNHKRTNRWDNSRSTVNAIYALLSGDDKLKQASPDFEIRLGDKSIKAPKKSEAGTGYFKTTWEASEITPDMSDIQIKNKGNTMLWGGLYWQYFEDLDKIGRAKTPLNIKKGIFVERQTDRGTLLETVSEKGIHVGDKVVVRIELRVDRDMDYVHMKDLRAAGLEPMNETSGYRYQDGLGYYQEIKDASVNFFFSTLRKGTYVFEYRLKASQTGDFSNGYTNIQCLYAPEFSSHSEGTRILINN